MTTNDEQDGQASDDQARHARHVAPSRRGRWPWIAVSVMVLAGVTASIVYLTTTGNSQPDAFGTGTTASAGPTGLNSAAPATSVPAQAGTATPGPKSAAALGLAAGALNLPEKSKAQAAKWDRGRGGAALAVVSEQVGAVTQAGSLRQYATMKASCSALAADVRTAQSAPPIPQAAMQALYAKALTNIAAGAQDCVKAITVRPDGEEQVRTNQDQAMLRQSAAELQAGAKNLFRATTEIKALSHH
jgi:hypothetical protein